MGKTQRRKQAALSVLHAGYGVVPPFVAKMSIFFAVALA